MSSRKQRQLLQLSIGTLLIFQFLFLFSPSASTNILSSIWFEPEPALRVHYDLKIMSVDGEQLSRPLHLSVHWENLGVEDYSAAQFLVDDLARALNRDNLDQAQSIYVELAENHLVKLDSYEFEIQKINSDLVPIQTGGVAREVEVIDTWSSNQLSEIQTR